MQLGLCFAGDTPHVVPSGKRIRIKLARELEQIAKLDPLIAAHAGNGRQPLRVSIGKVIHDGVAEPFLVVENVVRDGEPASYLPGVVDILASAAGTLPSQSPAVIVKLKRHP